MEPVVQRKGVCKGWLSNFRKAEDGGATIEACLWLPFFVFFLVMALDASSIFMQQSRIHRIVYDGNRQYAVNVFKGDEKAFEDWLKTAISNIAPHATVDANVSTTGILTTNVRYPANDTDLTGATGIFSKLNMRVQAIHLMES